ncbi:MAG TPA: GAF and ANTAR domain-containing protein [Streptomyces sp.]|nr:GAF and ANTAR domain-containing protein [Streptomyces sp.]
MNEPRVVHLVTAAAQGGAEGLPARLCSALCSGLEVDGATVSLLTQSSWRQFFGSVGARALELEQLQFGVGEGPCITAAATGKPVIVPDLHTAVTPWPIFGPAAREQLPDVGAIYAFPMMLPGEEVEALGSVDLLRLRPSTPDQQFIAQGSQAAGAVTRVLLRAFDAQLADDGTLPWQPADLIDTHWGATRRATGLLAQRLRITLDDALARIRARAFASGRSVPDISSDILNLPPDQLTDGLP